MNYAVGLIYDSAMCSIKLTRNVEYNIPTLTAATIGVEQMECI